MSRDGIFFFLRCRRLIVKVIGVNKTKQPFLDPGKMAASSWVFDIHPGLHLSQADSVAKGFISNPWVFC